MTYENVTVTISAIQAQEWTTALKALSKFAEFGLALSLDFFANFWTHEVKPLFSLKSYLDAARRKVNFKSLA